MPDELAVHVSRRELHSLEVPENFGTEGSFDVRLVNHGNSLHVHLHLDDALSKVARMEATNHYVEGDSERVVRVDVADGREEDVFGRLKVVSAYGAQTRWVGVDLAVPREDDSRVRVDESLSKPSPQPEPEPGLRDRPELLVGGAGLLALAVAGASALASGSPLVALGALVVLAGVAVAAVLLAG